MRKFWRMIAATMVLAAVLCVGACASDFDAAAEDLSAIGMFRGTGTGFELDRAPTRAEAAIMLVRLYGAEEEAAADYTAGKIQHPFKDVPSFAAPHVAWLYEKELTKGMSADTFGASSACIVRDYTTFLLRALGYQDGTDFAYADAETFADEKGFYDWEIIDWPFTRGNLAALTYQALATDTKDGDTWLLESLVESGAVDAILEDLKVRTAANLSAHDGENGALPYGVCGGGGSGQDRHGCADRAAAAKQVCTGNRGEDLFRVYGQPDPNKGEWR